MNLYNKITLAALILIVPYSGTFAENKCPGPAIIKTINKEFKNPANLKAGVGMMIGEKMWQVAIVDKDLKLPVHEGDFGIVGLSHSFAKRPDIQKDVEIIKGEKPQAICAYYQPSTQSFFYLTLLEGKKTAVKLPSAEEKK